MSQEFTLAHENVNEENVKRAADKIEAQVGKLLNGDKKALAKINLEDLAVLVQFARTGFTRAE